jgi:hypothetical protein
MTTIVLNDELTDKVVKIGNYKSPQEAVDAILSEYIQTHQPDTKLFDKLHIDLGIPDDEIDTLFMRDKDAGRNINL